MIDDELLRRKEMELARREEELKRRQRDIEKEIQDYLLLTAKKENELNKRAEELTDKETELEKKQMEFQTRLTAGKPEEEKLTQLRLLVLNKILKKDPKFIASIINELSLPSEEVKKLFNK